MSVLRLAIIDPVKAQRLKNQSPMLIWLDRYRGSNPNGASFLIHESDPVLWIEPHSYAPSPENIIERNPQLQDPLVGGHITAHSLDVTILNCDESELLELIARPFGSHQPRAVSVGQYSRANVRIRGTPKDWGNIVHIVESFGLEFIG